ncbi:MAG: hypothetical protein WC450_12315, partial [Candidatus Omnitrophota bacterium]
DQLKIITLTGDGKVNQLAVPCPFFINQVNFFHGPFFTGVLKKKRFSALLGKSCYDFDWLIKLSKWHKEKSKKG